MKNKLLIIGFVWPEPKSSAAGSRMLQLIKLFQNQSYTITFCSAAKMSDNTFDLQSIGVRVQTIQLNASSFDDFIKDYDPSVVIFDRFMTEEQYGWRVAAQCPNVLRLLDTEDFHGLRKARELAVKQKQDLSLDHLQNDVSKREIASMYRCDLSLIISEAEMDMLSNRFEINQSLLYYLPFLLDPISNEERSTLPVFESREHFMTIGNFLHAPNYDAVLFLKQTIWPLIRAQLPKTELHIYGAYVSPKIAQLNNKKEGFLVKGFAEDVNVVMQNAKVCLASLRFGAGLKGKLIDAMKNGTPAVMTNVAAEGLFGRLNVNGFMEDDAIAFAEKAVLLYNNRDIWKLKQQNGYDVLNQRFNFSDFENKFFPKLLTLKKTLKAHRQQNFIGQLLMHHTLQSTKYMGKWIELKNKSGSNCG